MFPIGDDDTSRRTVPLVAAQTGGVAYMTYIGGFLAGFALTFLFRGSRGAQQNN